MENRMEHRNITGTLMNVFQYAFVETAPYSFFIPTEEQYVAVNLQKKIYHCLHCRKTIEVNYNQSSVVYFSKARFEKQREIYQRRGLNFPDKREIDAQQEFTCHDEGYCVECAKLKLNIEDCGQKIYNLCLSLHQRDEKVLDEARAIMGELVKSWTRTLTESTQLDGYDLSSYTALKDLICAVILRDLTGMEACLAAYRRDVQMAVTEINKCLSAMSDKWEVYAARPVAIYESMSDELYHEYTIVFPVKETKAQDFFVRKKIDRQRVHMFLDQVRVQTVTELIMEAGFVDAWVDCFIDHVTTLKK